MSPRFKKPESLGDVSSNRQYSCLLRSLCVIDGEEADLDISIVVIALPNEAQLFIFGRLNPACCDEGRECLQDGDRSRDVIVGRCL